jgi:hypothetical protein
MGERDVDTQGLETLVLVREGTAWKIRHSHTSGRPRRPPADPRNFERFVGRDEDTMQENHYRHLLSWRSFGDDGTIP